MDFIRPIGPVERDVEALRRVERTDDAAKKREREARKRARSRQLAVGSWQNAAETPPEGPVEGDDGLPHIDVRA